MFEVQDTGPGISPVEHEELFMPFSQTVTGFKTKEGTGLGLAISRQFARLLGGELTTGNIGAPAPGALFSLDLPVSAQFPEERAWSTTVLGARAIAIGLAPGQARHRILVAEDRPENSELLRLLLQQLGFEVRVAVNGVEAVNVWHEWNPDLILMDMRMPIMNGHEATRQIKSAPAGSHPIIIGMTAGVFEEEAAQGQQEGCDDFLRKPFRPADITDLLVKHLGVRFIYQGAARSVPERPLQVPLIGWGCDVWLISPRPGTNNCGRPRPPPMPIRSNTSPIRSVMSSLDWQIRSTNWLSISSMSSS